MNAKFADLAHAARRALGLAAGAVRPWVAPAAPTSLALFRLTIGAVAVVDFLELLPGYDRYFGPDGYVPRTHWHPPAESFSYFRWLRDETACHAVAVLGLVFALALAIGFLPRLSAALTFFVLASLHDRCPSLLDSGDIVLRIMLLPLVFFPSTGRLAVSPVGASARPGASFALRFAQVQVCIVYFSTALIKLQGASWRQGTALAYVLMLDSFSRASWVGLANNALFVNAATYFTLAFELLFGILVWFPRFRWPVIAAGVALHLGIEVLMYIPMFSWIMIATYACFIPERDAARIADWIEARAAVALGALGRLAGRGRPAGVARDHSAPRRARYVDPRV